ncbi:MAG: hypothetical protein P9L92_01930 [Candidatus Electryonea clarkiae]|nr:hypothetical protein [Candidatus Electryonea clarkiae]MDP8285364.1 hypothetical protein [Candidatus Electryonea clarkiae]
MKTTVTLVALSFAIHIFHPIQVFTQIEFVEHTITGNFDGASSVYATDIDGDDDIDILGTAMHADDSHG